MKIFNEIHKKYYFKANFSTISIFWKILVKIHEAEINSKILNKERKF